MNARVGDIVTFMTSMRHKDVQALEQEGPLSSAPGYGQVCAYMLFKEDGTMRSSSKSQVVFFYIFLSLPAAVVSLWRALYIA